MLETLRNLETEGYVRSVAHNELPLLVFNYTPKTQFEKAFGDYPVLRLCRGLVLDTSGNIVLRPYEKFFNYSEHAKSELPIGDNNFVIETKLDGSLLIVGRFMDTVVYSTRGSFYSDQALMGAKLFKELYHEDWIEPGYTYLFELIGPSNRIVNQYAEDTLVLHGVLNTANGLDVEVDKPFQKVPSHEVHGAVFGDELYEKLVSLNIPNEEGFVLKVKEEGLPTWMCKIKFADYCVLHKIVTGLSSKGVWEMLRDDKSFDEILELVPDEFFEWLTKTKHNLEQSYTIIEDKAKSVYKVVKTLPTRKEQAMELLKNHKDVSAITFKMLDGADYSNLVWDMVKPEKFEQPFVTKGEE